MDKLWRMVTKWSERILTMFLVYTIFFRLTVWFGIIPAVIAVAVLYAIWACIKASTDY